MDVFLYVKTVCVLVNRGYFVEKTYMAFWMILFAARPYIFLIIS